MRSLVFLFLVAVALHALTCCCFTEALTPKPYLPKGPPDAKSKTLPSPALPRWDDETASMIFSDKRGLQVNNGEMKMGRDFFGKFVDQHATPVVIRGNFSEILKDDSKLVFADSLATTEKYCEEFFRNYDFIGRCMVTPIVSKLVRSAAKKATHNLLIEVQWLFEQVDPLLEANENVKRALGGTPLVADQTKVYFFEFQQKQDATLLLSCASIDVEGPTPDVVGKVYVYWSSKLGIDFMDITINDQTYLICPTKGLGKQRVPYSSL